MRLFNFAFLQKLSPSPKKPSVWGHLCIFLLLTNAGTAQGVVSGSISNQNKNNNLALQLNGGWQWDKNAMSNATVIAQNLSIRQNNGTTNVTVQLAGVPEMVKSRCNNWEGIGTKEMTWYNTGGYYRTEIGGYTNRNSQGVIESYARYYLHLYRNEQTPAHILLGTVIEEKWTKPSSDRVKVQPSATVVYSGQWFHPGMNQGKTSTDGKKFGTEKNIQDMITQITQKEPVVFTSAKPGISLPQKSPGTPLTPQSGYKISQIRIESLQTDDERDVFGEKIIPSFQNKAEFGGELTLRLVATVQGKNLVRFNVGEVLDQPVKNGVIQYQTLQRGEKQAARGPFSTYMGVAVNEFEQLSMELSGFLQEVDPVFADPEVANGNPPTGKKFRKPEHTTLQTKEQSTRIPLKSLRWGENHLDITANGKSFRVWFTLSN